MYICFCFLLSPLCTFLLQRDEYFYSKRFFPKLPRKGFFFLNFDQQTPAATSLNLLGFNRWQVINNRWRVTGDTWHMTHDTWHMTHGKWHRTHDKWQITYDKFFNVVGIVAPIPMHREIQSLPYAGFKFWISTDYPFFIHPVFKIHLKFEDKF